MGLSRTATGRAAEAVTCFEIDRTPFFKLMERTPLLSVHLLQLVCRRVRWMTRLVADSAFLVLRRDFHGEQPPVGSEFGSTVCARGKPAMVSSPAAPSAQVVHITLCRLNIGDWGRSPLGRESVRLRYV